MLHVCRLIFTKHAAPSTPGLTQTHTDIALTASSQSELWIAAQV